MAKVTLLCDSWVVGSIDFVHRWGLVSDTGCRLPRCVGESFCWVEDCKLFATNGSAT